MARLSLSLSISHTQLRCSHTPFFLRNGSGLRRKGFATGEKERRWRREVERNK